VKLAIGVKPANAVTAVVKVNKAVKSIRRKVRMGRISPRGEFNDFDYCKRLQNIAQEGKRQMQRHASHPRIGVIGG
jgi:hypothetical protein